MTPTRQRLATLLLAPASLLLLLLAAELFFRTVLPAPDIPEAVLTDGVLRHVPGQRGVYWTGDARAPFSINAQGWNAARADYPRERGRALRLAVVGDSYVEALQVPPDKSLAEDLERELADLPGGVEAFRYGMSGAPLSQYLHMARRCALPDRPDVLLVLMVHNDFDESYRPTPGSFWRSFLRLRLEPDGGVAELAPEPYAPGPAGHLRRLSATWRYLVYGRQIRPDTLRRLFFGPEPAARYEANIDTAGLAAREGLDRRAAAYVFARLREECARSGTRLLLVMDGVRAPMEAGRPDDADAGALRLNRLAGEEAARLGIAFLDLHPVFRADFAAHGQPFTFQSDGHWNARGHAVAARAVAERLRALGWLGPPARQ